MRLLASQEQGRERGLGDSPGLRGDVKEIPLPRKAEHLGNSGALDSDCAGPGARVRKVAVHGAMNIDGNEAENKVPLRSAL
jgi:hypothetical protein